MDHRNSPDLQSAGPRRPGRLLAEVEYGAAARRRTVRIVGLSVLVLALGIVVVAVMAREGILANWPATADVYQRFGLIDRPGAGLKVSVVTTRRVDSMVVNGEIVNGAGEARRVPRLRVTLYDGRRSDLDFRLIDPPVASLAPGATVRFNTVFDHPNMTATGAAAIFTSEP